MHVLLHGCMYAWMYAWMYVCMAATVEEKMAYAYAEQRKTTALFVDRCLRTYGLLIG